VVFSGILVRCDGKHEWETATIVSVYEKSVSPGRYRTQTEWRTAVSFDDGVRKILMGNLGKIGDKITVRVIKKDGKVTSVETGAPFMGE